MAADKLRPLSEGWYGSPRGHLLGRGVEADAGGRLDLVPAPMEGPENPDVAERDDEDRDSETDAEDDPETLL